MLKSCSPCLSEMNRSKCPWEVSKRQAQQGAYHTSCISSDSIASTWCDDMAISGCFRCCRDKKEESVLDVVKQFKRQPILKFSSRSTNTRTQCNHGNFNQSASIGYIRTQTLADMIIKVRPSVQGCTPGESIYAQQFVFDTKWWKTWINTSLWGILVA